MTKVIALLRRLFDRRFASKLAAGAEAAAPYLRAAYEIAAVAAKLTPTRADDELIALADALGVPALWTAEDKGDAVRQLVFRALKKRFPEASDRALNRAIELAYGALKP